MILTQSIQLWSQQKPLTGTWSGTLQSKTMSAFVVFRIEEDSGGVYKGVMDSPDQFAFDIKFGKIRYENDSIFIPVPVISASFKGVVNDSLMKGTWKQSGLKFLLTMRKDTSYKKPVFHRPQTPEPPFPYTSEEIVFENKKDGVTLSGTLTKPGQTGKYPAVILISGSGPQDRNEELIRHKPFLVISDYLTRKGIAVLRYDDRGVGKSSGNYSKATTADFASDVEAAVRFLMKRKDIDHQNVGLLGHSEGGMIAPMVASNDKRIAFLVLMAAPGVSIDRLMIKQLEMIAADSKMSDSIIALTQKINTETFRVMRSEPDNLKAIEKIREVYNKYLSPFSDEDKKEMGFSSAAIETALIQFMSPWFRYFVNFNPSDYLSRVRCPVLALNGDQDHQVFSIDNLAAVRSNLEKAGNTHFTIKELKGMNHLFQKCNQCTVKEYAQIEETVNVDVLEIIASWIQQQIKKQK